MEFLKKVVKMKLDEMKQALDRSKVHIDLCKGLVEERERLQEQLDLLKEEIGEQIMLLHQNKLQKRGEKELEIAIEEKSQLIARLKEKIGDVDHQLDLLEDEQDISFETRRNQIIAKIREQYPQTNTEFALFEEKLVFYQKELARLNLVKNKISTFYEILQEGVKSQKRRGFWNTLFGRHPKIHLSNSIHQATKEAEKLKTKLSGPFLKFVDAFLEEAKKSWNHSLYEKKYFEYFEKFNTMKLNLEIEIKTRENEKKSLEDSLEALIDKYCKFPA